MDDSGKTKKTYLHICKDCGNPFKSEAKNTQYCVSCIDLRREMQIKNFIDKRRVLNEQKKRQRYHVITIKVDGEDIQLPKKYFESAELSLADHLNMSYGKFKNWIAFHSDEYMVWCRKVARDYKYQCEALQTKSPVTPSESVFSDPFE